MNLLTRRRSTLRPVLLPSLYSNLVWNLYPTWPGSVSESKKINLNLQRCSFSSSFNVSPIASIFFYFDALFGLRVSGNNNIFKLHDKKLDARRSLKWFSIYRVAFKIHNGTRKDFVRTKSYHRFSTFFCCIKYDTH